MDNFSKKDEKIPQRLCKKCGKCKKNDNNFLNLPKSIWDKMPEGCGFEGWLFQKQEVEKQKIRRQKELLLSLKVLIETANNLEKNLIQERIKEIENNIKAFEKYGAKNW